MDAFKTIYVLGFIFDVEYKKILLIEKKRPTWQSGFLNGVGGKVENGESVHLAMKREAFEETGLSLSSWDYVVKMEGLNWAVHCFKTKTFQISLAKTMTDEDIYVLRTEDVLNQKYNTLFNLSWLIPFCIDQDSIFAKVEYKKQNILI